MQSFIEIGGAVSSPRYVVKYHRQISPSIHILMLLYHVIENDFMLRFQTPVTSGNIEFC